MDKNYLIQPGQRNHFIDYFEAHFVWSQRAVGMHVLGQFRMVAEPNRFVWLRGFTDRAARLAGLRGFYKGPVWQKYRGRANEMIADSDQAYLLRLVGSDTGLTGGRTSETVAAELAAGTISPDTGLIGVDFFQCDPARIESASLETAANFRKAGIQVRAVMAADLIENDYPRLPIIQRAGEYVILSAYPSEAEFKGRRAPWGEAASVLRPHNTWQLAPTRQSPLRW